MKKVSVLAGSLLLITSGIFFLSGWYPLVPAFVVLSLAIMTRRALEPLIVGCSVGFLMAPRYGNQEIESTVFKYGTEHALGFPMNLLAGLEDTINRDIHNYGLIWVVLICMLFGSLIQLMIASGGLYKLVEFSGKFVKGKRDSLLMSFVLSVLLFLDDYLNALAVGNTMRPITDKWRVSRQKLAMILSLTITPIAVIAPISSWTVFYGSQLMNIESVAAANSNPVSAFSNVIFYNYGAWISILVAILVIYNKLPVFTAIKHADAIAQYAKPVENPDNIPMQEEKRGKLWYVYIPLLILLFFTLLPYPSGWNERLFTIDGFTSNIDALRGGATAFGATYLLYLFFKVMPFEKLSENFIKGLESMTFVLVLLTFSYLLKEVQDVLGFNAFITAKLEGIVNPVLLPAILFVIVAALTWASSSSWGLYIILLPLTVMLCKTTGAHFWLVQGALISGTVWGNAACLFSDNRLLISRSTGLNMIEQGITQLPYQLIVLAATAISFLIAGLII
jgi:tetracycline resistance efflux pump